MIFACILIALVAIFSLIFSWIAIFGKSYVFKYDFDFTIFRQIKDEKRRKARRKARQKARQKARKLAQRKARKRKGRAVGKYERVKGVNDQNKTTKKLDQRTA